MATIKLMDLKLNIQNLREMRKSEPFMNLVEGYAEKIRDACGEGYATSSNVGQTRANARVYTQDIDAIIDNSENNTLLKSVSRRYD